MKKKNLWVVVAVLAVLALLSQKEQFFEQPTLEPTTKNTSRRLRKIESRTNICGFYLGMDQLEAIDEARKLSRVKLEPGGVPFHPCHLFEVEGQPVLITYGENKEIVWISGPSLQLQSGVILRYNDSLEEILEKVGQKLRPAASSRTLCDGSTQGFAIGSEALISKREDETLVFSLGLQDGWKAALNDGLTWNVILRELGR